MDREQLAVLRRQAEEEYMLDLAAINRLQRRYPIDFNPIPSSRISYPASAYSSPAEWAKLESRMEAVDPLWPPSALVAL